MKKIILAGASTFAILAFAGAANAQNVDVNINPLLGTLQNDLDGLGGVYINAAINDRDVNGSVNIDTDGLTGGLNASRVVGTGEVSAAGAGAVAAVPNTIAGAVGLAGAGEVTLDVIGTTIASTDVLKTTAIGAVNTGITSLGAASRREFRDFSTTDENEGDVAFSSSAADSASNTSNTAARAAAAATSLLIDGATASTRNNISDSTVSGPAAIVAANYAVNNAIVDGSVDITGATSVAIAGTATTAIGAVNTGTITNALPGSITIVAGETSSTKTTNTNVGGNTP